MFEPMGDKGVVDSIRAGAECNGQNVVERSTSGMWLRVDRQNTCTSADVKLSDHFDDFELKTRDVGSDGLGAQEASCKATVLAPGVMRGQNTKQQVGRHLPSVIVRCSGNSTTNENDL